ncbi:MAG: hypothetical protein ACI97A_004489 [Planctomycetota bacterium]|jgi:hypothetical protein
MRDFCRFWAGLIFWGTMIGLGWFYVKEDADAAKAASRLTTHLNSSPHIFDAQFPASAPLAVGNPVRVRVKNGFYVAGRVTSVATNDKGQMAGVAIFPEYAPLMGAKTRLIAARTAGDVGWVVKTLLPEDTQVEVRKIITARWNRERDQLLRDLRPGLTKLMEETLKVVQEEFPELTRTHKEDFDTIGLVFKERGWDAHVEDVFSTVLWPMIQERAEPVLDDVGDEIVNAFPVWSMSWAYLADSIPFTDKDGFEKKVRKFIKQKAIPILVERESAIREMASTALNDTLKEEKTVKKLQLAAEDIAADPRFRKALQSLIKALFLDNPRFRELAAGIPSRPGLRGPVDDFIESFEPAIRRVANRLLMNERRDGINPDLARVLRRKLLREDEDWVLLELVEGDQGEVPQIIPGEDGGRR